MSKDTSTLKPSSVEEANPSREYATGNGSDIVRKYATAEEVVANAPKDIVEEDVEDVFGGLTIRVRALTAAQSAHVRQTSVQLEGRTTKLAWARMEMEQFKLGVIEPKFTDAQVIMLHRQSGPSFNKVIAKLDEISGTGKEELRKAQQEFQGHGE